MTGEALVSILVIIGAVLGLFMATRLYFRRKDLTPLILVPALLVTLLLYIFTFIIEVTDLLWLAEYRIYYRLNALLLVTAIAIVFYTRLAHRNDY